MTLRGVIIALRWISRIAGGLLIVLVAVIALGEGVPDPRGQSADVNACLLAMLVMMIGQLLAWKREAAGAALILSGFTLFAVINHGIELNAVFAPMLFTGVAYAVCAWWSRSSPTS